MRIGDNIFLFAGLLFYLISVGIYLINPRPINIEFFMNMAFFPLVTFYVFYLLDVKIFYPKEYEKCYN